MQQLSASVTATAVMTGAVFPNLTQPYFEITGGYTDGLGGIMMAAFAPLVKAEKRAEWEEYSTRNQDWMATGETLRKIHPGHRDPMHGTHQDHEHDRRLQEEVRANISGSIFHWESGEKVPEDNLSEDDYAPLWQVSPPDASSINANLFSENGFKDLFSSMKATNHSVLSSVTEIGDMFDFMFDPEEKDKKNAPHAFIMEPVYSEFSDDPELVGMVIALTNFGNLLDRLIPEHANGIICVVTDPCGPTVSYVLNGPKSLFLGYGDLHDPSFDKYKRSALIEVKGNGVCNHELTFFLPRRFKKLSTPTCPSSTQVSWLLLFS